MGEDRGPGQAVKMLTGILIRIMGPVGVIHLIFQKRNKIKKGKRRKTINPAPQ